MASAASAQRSKPRPTDIPGIAFWFGEDQARYVVTVPADKAEAVLERARGGGVPVAAIGTTGGDALTLPGERPILVTGLREALRGLAARPTWPASCRTLEGAEIADGDGRGRNRAADQGSASRTPM